MVTWFLGDFQDNPMATHELITWSLSHLPCHVPSFSSRYKLHQTKQGRKPRKKTKEDDVHVFLLQEQSMFDFICHIDKLREVLTLEMFLAVVVGGSCTPRKWLPAAKSLALQSARHCAMLGLKLNPAELGEPFFSLTHQGSTNSARVELL